MCGVLLRQPADLIDLFLNLQTLKVVKLWLMALEGAVHVILSLGKRFSLTLLHTNKKRKIKQSLILECGKNSGSKKTARFGTADTAEDPGGHGAFITPLILSALLNLLSVLCAHLRLPLEDDYAAPFVPCGQELSCVVELNSGDDISWRKQTWTQKMKKTGWNISNTYVTDCVTAHLLNRLSTI